MNSDTLKSVPKWDHEVLKYVLCFSQPLTPSQVYNLLDKLNAWPSLTALERDTLQIYLLKHYEGMENNAVIRGFLRRVLVSSLSVTYA